MYHKKYLSILTILLFFADTSHLIACTGVPLQHLYLLLPKKQCSLCLNEDHDFQIKLSLCKHSFHKDCLEEWFKYNIENCKFDTLYQCPIAPACDKKCLILEHYRKSINQSYHQTLILNGNIKTNFFEYCKFFFLECVTLHPNDQFNDLLYLLLIPGLWFLLMCLVYLRYDNDNAAFNRMYLSDFQHNNTL